MRLLFNHFLIGFFAVNFLACSGEDQKKQAPESEREESLVIHLDDLDIQGHRGYRALYPENSPLAAIKALDAGATTIECDVVITKDKVVVLSHKPWLNTAICLDSLGNVPGSPGEENNIYSMTFEELQKCDCGSVPRSDFPDFQPVPYFKQSLDSLIRATDLWVNSKLEAGLDVDPVGFNIEIKSKPEWDNHFSPPIQEFVDLVIDALDRNGLAYQATIQSFDPRPLNLIHEHRPEIELSFLIWDPSESTEEQLAKLDFTPTILSPNEALVNEEMVQLCANRGMKLIPWTINDPQRVEELIMLGVDGIISDDPAMVVEVRNSLLGN